MGDQIAIARVYEQTAPGTYRILVDRIWPRGVRKDSGAVDVWVKDVAPSTELRKWYDHDEAKADEFVERYQAELAANPEAIAQLRVEIADHDNAVLVYAAKSPTTNATVLAEYLAEHP